MATAVLDLEFTQLPSEINGLDHYSHALALIRYRGVPVGKTLIPLVDGRIDGAELPKLLIEGAGWPLCEHWLCDYLDSNETGEKQSTNLLATIAICTRDHPQDLRQCLEALKRLPDDGQEILVIDNGSKTDETRRLVDTFCMVRYIREDTPGLDAARNRALRDAGREIVAFMDDDSIPDPGWLRGLLRNFTDPRVLCVTGLTMPLELETEAQEWFERHSTFCRGFRRTVFDSSSHNPLATGPIGAGTNMAFRKDVIKHVGFFDEALDGGTPTRSGGDTEMFSRILIRGYRIVYEPGALNWHRHRRTREEVRKTLFGYGVGVYAFLTRSVIREGEFTAPKIAWNWFRYQQFRALARSLLRRPGAIPLDFLVAELCGCAWGPWAYLISSRRERSKRIRNNKVLG